MTLLGRGRADERLRRAAVDEEVGRGDRTVPPGEPSSRRPIPLPEKRVKARDVQWKAFESDTLASTATTVGEPGDDSLEGQLERWRRTVVGSLNEKELLDWEYRAAADGRHYLLVTYTE